MTVLIIAAAGQAWSQQRGLPRDLVVRGLSFTGNHAIDDYTLGISISTSNSSWAARWFGVLGEKRYFDETEFRRDVLRIQALYRLSGFLEARVDTLVARGRDNVKVRFIITEGRPVRVTQLVVSGVDSNLARRKLLGTLPLRKGDPFSRFLLRASADSIRTILQDHGFPFVEVFSEYDMDSAARAAQVTYTVDAGKLARISAVAVTGTSRIQRSVVRRAVGLRAGQPFSRAALNETQRNLYRTDLFTYVSVGLVDSLRTGPDDSLVAIQVRVNEGKLHAVRAGTGYGALDCFRGVTGWTGRNFFGGGRSLDVGARISKVGSQFCPGLQSDTVTERRMLNYELTLTFREPFLLHRSTSGSVSLFAERHSELSTFTRIAQGGQLTVSQILGINVPVNFTYDLSSGRTIADPAVFCTFLNICRLEDTVFSARRRESTLGAEFVWNRANSAQDPTGGNMLSLQVRYASQLIGSDAQRQFTKGTVEFADYERVGRRMVFAWRIRLGALLPARLTALSTPQQFVPPDERFYLGGPNTVRGYSQNELGPLVRVVTGYDTVKTGNSILANAAGSDSLVPQTRTSPTGGDRVVLGNVELRVPLAGRLSGALFVDVGEVYGGQPRAPIETLHVTPGVGIRFATPIGPVRFDVGYNPRSPTPGPLYLPVPPDLTLVDPNYQPPSPTTFFNHLRFHLSVGQPF